MTDVGERSGSGVEEADVVDTTAAEQMRLLRSIDASMSELVALLRPFAERYGGKRPAGRLFETLIRGS